MTGVPAITKVSALACMCVIGAFPLGQRMIGHAVADEPVTAAHTQQASAALDAGAETANLDPASSCAAVDECSSDKDPSQNMVKAEPRTPSEQFKIGERINPQKLHIVTRPGLYGIGRPPRGSSYGVISGRLIRFDPETLQVLSVIRDVDKILD